MGDDARSIEVLHADESIVVVDKPPGMLTHANSFDRDSPTVVSVLGSRLGARVHNVHRLDRMTTGAMVVARSPSAASELARQFREREVEKRYLAVVRGHLDEDGTIDLPIADLTDGERREASTSYRCLARSRVDEPVGKYGEGWFSLVELDLHTGRSHQARRHLHRINHPVIGDNKHGDKTWNRWAWARIGERHLFLRAIELRFKHPADGAAVEVTLGLPEVWCRLLDEIRLEAPKRYLGSGTGARVRYRGRTLTPATGRSGCSGSGR